MESLNLEVLVILMHLEVKQHTVPHLKALNSGLEHSSGHGRGSTFKKHFIVLNITHFTIKTGQALVLCDSTCT